MPKLVTHWVTYLNKRQVELQIHSLFYERLLAEAFYLTGDIEKYGMGFIRIRKQLNELKTATYKSSEIGDFFRVVLLDIRSSDVEKDPVKEFSDSEKDL